MSTRARRAHRRGGDDEVGEGRTYGNVVDIALIPGADGVENEPHHMQYMWFPGQPLWAGGLFSSRLFTWDPSALPKLTLMGGPLQVYGMTPGEVVHIGAKGQILGGATARTTRRTPAASPTRSDDGQNLRLWGRCRWAPAPLYPSAPSAVQPRPPSVLR